MDAAPAQQPREQLLPERVDMALLGKMVPNYFKRTIEVQRATVAP